MRVGGRTAQPDELRLKKAGRVIERMRLHVLRQRQAHRATVDGVGHDLNGTGQGSEQLFRPADAVEVAAHRPKHVVG